MSASDWNLNPFERILFRVALLLAFVLISVRLGAIIVLWYAHHVR